ncbi:preprotein translocase subunit YajC [Enterococcus columbae]|uniref:Preprotein translocase, YajC subunit n=1 Tax=Enterococcus columbae DSM 7374 = ATCC 51263 TaxID=1121865 RepID=S0K0X4_9ENTE|nr:preprotein translocase subunit YajC [Enterococcus columbae]EOT38172.1 preprotein translocase, YajC subunit [Enterococcus columbae DSM 7374 = ATCC 51263]EOW83697.1 preprotein translocase, YajC subunit [Enterococcus columbae DSM 7374 = ATCC 51263]
MNSLISLLPMLILFGGMMFFMSRSQKKQQEARQKLLDGLKPGSKVVTIGGLHGVVAAVNEEANTVDLDCEGVILEFDRSAIRTVSEAAPVVEETKEEVSEDK